MDLNPKKEKYNHIISLGFFCNIALELEQKGLRDGSYPFDWVITDIVSVNKLIKNKFQDLFKEDLLYRNKIHHYIVQHKDYKFDFYHDFNRDIDLGQQIFKVSMKYNKRIHRFYSNIQEPTLFIRYIENDEVEYWYNDAKELITSLKSYNIINSVMLIANKEVSIDISRVVEGVIKVFFIERDLDDIVARKILKDSKQIRDYLLNIHYPVFSRGMNYLIYYRKILKKFSFKKLINKIRGRQNKA